MPRQNRVTPFGEFEASPARGLFMGTVASFMTIMATLEGLDGSIRLGSRAFSPIGVSAGRSCSPAITLNCFSVTKLLRWQQATGHVVNVVPWTIGGT